MQHWLSPQKYDPRDWAAFVALACCFEAGEAEAEQHHKETA